MSEKEIVLDQYKDQIANYYEVLHNRFNRIGIEYSLKGLKMLDKLDQWERAFEEVVFEQGIA